MCGGAIDYDYGFNNLVCTKCGAKIFARDLQANIENQTIIIKGRKEHSTMLVKCFIPGQGAKVTDTTRTSKVYLDTRKEKEKKKSSSSMTISILNNNKILSPEEELEALRQRTRERKEAAAKQSNLPDVNEVKISLNREEKQERNQYQFNPKNSAPFPVKENQPKSYMEMNMENDEEEIQEYPVEDDSADTEDYQNNDVEDGEPYYSEDSKKETHAPAYINKDNRSVRINRATPRKRSESPVSRRDEERDYEKEAYDLLPDGENTKGYPASKKKNKGR